MREHKSGAEVKFRCTRTFYRELSMSMRIHCFSLMHKWKIFLFFWEPCPNAKLNSLWREMMGLCLNSINICALSSIYYPLYCLQFSDTFLFSFRLWSFSTFSKHWSWILITMPKKLWMLRQNTPSYIKWSCFYPSNSKGKIQYNYLSLHSLLIRNVSISLNEKT